MHYFKEKLNNPWVWHMHSNQRAKIEQSVITGEKQYPPMRVSCNYQPAVLKLLVVI